MDFLIRFLLLLWKKMQYLCKYGFFFFFKFFWLCHAAHGILVPWPRVEPLPCALEVHCLNHWNTRKILLYSREYCSVMYYCCSLMLYHHFQFWSDTSKLFHDELVRISSSIILFITYFDLLSLPFRFAAGLSLFERHLLELTYLLDACFSQCVYFLIGYGS